MLTIYYIMGCKKYSRSSPGFVFSNGQSPRWTHVNTEGAFGTEIIFNDQKHREKLDGCHGADRHAGPALSAKGLVNKNLLRYNFFKHMFHNTMINKYL